VNEALRAGELFQIALDDGATDTEVAQWWRSLSDQDKADFISLRPDLIKNLDGVPAAVRDQANRNLLPKLEAEVSAALQVNPNDENAKRRKQTLDAVHAQIDSKTDKQLLVVDLSGEIPKVAIATGNVDTADHVSVYVPGTGGVPWDKPDSGNDLATYVPQAEALKTTTEELLNHAGSNETVATIAWIGYDAPDNLTQAALGTDANRAAPALASFLNGVDSARGDDDPHLTVIGHSYGSVVTSEALQRGTATDDVVFTGSPGLESSGASWSLPDLNLQSGHVYNESASGDWVVRTEIFGPRPDRLDGVVDLSTKVETTPIGEMRSATGHSEYFNARTTALYNQAVVIAGLGDNPTYVRKDD
jgi:pimeloyl-ACP methyl ester carboxylesterase